MRSFFTKNRLVLMSAAVIVSASAAVMHFTDICNLHAVVLDNQPIPNWQGQYGLSGSRLLVNQPIDLVATELLGSNGVVKVDVDMALPGTIRIRTNDYTPVAFLVDRTIGEIWGLDQSGRIVPLKQDLTNWELPFFTGLVAGRAYGACEDLRVSVALNQIALLGEMDHDASALVGEVSFASTDYLLVRLEGLRIPVKVSADGLARQLDAVTNFIRKFHPDLSDALALDPRFGNLVVKECVPDTTSESKDSTRYHAVEALD